jgi:hypothetical protein
LIFFLFIFSIKDKTKVVFLVQFSFKISFTLFIYSEINALDGTTITISQLVSDINSLNKNDFQELVGDEKEKNIFSLIFLYASC